jgi:hypothetical protein
MSQRLRSLCALVLLSGCSSAPEPPAIAEGTGGMVAGGGLSPRGPGTGGSGPDGGPAGAGGTGPGGGGGPARDGGPASGLPDGTESLPIGRARPDARVEANAPGRDGALDAPAPDLRARSDAHPPDGGFRYPDPDGPLCGNAHHTLARTPAELLVVLDRSNSMADPTTPGRTRWDDARDAVIGAVTSASNLAWGLKVFPSMAAPTRVLVGCTVDMGADVGVGFGQAGAIGNALMHAGPPTRPLAGGTPTAPAILTGTAYLKTVTTAFPKYLVLVTDGQPTCAGPGPAMGVPVDPLLASVDALSAAAGAGIKTFVIGISATQFTANLNRLAEAGGMPRALEPRYYPAENRADLDAALQAISVAITSCVFPLVTRPLDPDFVGVTVGSMRVPRDLDHIDGWDYVNNGTAIEIYGPGCDALATGAAQNADIQFGCPD